MIVEAAGSEFVPLCIYNSTRGGKDAEILKKFKEPAMNNPVVRFLDADGKDIIPRMGNDWTTPGLMKRMIETLEKLERKPPTYLGETVAESKDAPQRAGDFLRKRPELHYLPLCAWQADRVDAALEKGEEIKDVLTPGQVELQTKLKAALEKDKAKIEALKPDRSPRGIAGYATALEKALKQ